MTEFSGTTSAEHPATTSPADSTGVALELNATIA